MAPPKDIARSYPKRGLTADVGFRSEPKFCGDGSVYFDGSSNSARTATSTDLAVGDTFTLTAWVWLKPNPGGASNYVITVGDPSGSNTASIAVLGSAGKIYSWNGAAKMETTIDCPTAQWLHVAVVIKPGGGNSQIFVDGVDKTSPHSVPFNVTSSSSSITIGDYFNTGANDWEGYIANACLFTESLTEDQVRQVMRASDYASHAAISTVEAFYPLSANFNDSTGNHNATLSGSVSFGVNRPQLPRGLDLARGAAQARVYTGRAIELDGSADYLLGDSSLNSAADLSYSAWVNLDSTSGIRTIIGENAKVTIYLYSNKIGVWNLWGTLGAGEYAEKQATNNAPTNTWVHVGVSYTYSSNTLKLYIDGVDQPTVPSPVVGPGSTSGKFEIGGRDNSGSPLQFLDGNVAGVKRFDVALTQAQIRELYHNPEQVLPTGVSANSLKRYYPLSDYNDAAGTGGGLGGRYFQDMGADGEPVEDKGSSNMLFAQPVPCPQLGLQQSASRISMQDTNPSTYYLGTMSGTPFTNQGTLSGWFILQEQPANGTYNVMYCLGIYQTDKDLLEINQDVTSGGVSRIWITNGGGSIGAEINYEFETGKLYNVTVTTLADAPYWQLWINGVKQTVPTRAFSNSRTTWDFGTNLIGGGRWGNTANYGGICHYIAAGCAAWNTVLSDSEIGQVYNSGVPGDVSGIASSNLQVWWKCDDLTSFKDYSGNGVSGAVTVGSFVPNLASFPENASGSTLVGDFSMKRKGVSILNLTGADDGTAIIPAQEAVYPKAGAANGYTVGFCYRKTKEQSGGQMVWGNEGTSTNNQFMCFQQVGASLRFNLGDGSSRPAVTTSAITDSDWHHYALTISYATTPAEVKIYVDGAVDHSSTQSITGPPTDIREMRLGEGLFDSYSPSGCFKFYQVALSADEVKRLAFSDLRLIKGLDNE